MQDDALFASGQVTFETAAEHAWQSFTPPAAVGARERGRRALTGRC